MADMEKTNYVIFCLVGFIILTFLVLGAPRLCGALCEMVTIPSATSYLVVKPHCWPQLCTGLHVCELADAQGSLLCRTAAV